MRTQHRDLNHARGAPEPAVIRKLNEHGEIEVRRNSPGRELLGKFPSDPLADLFIDTINSVCAGTCGCSGAVEAAYAI